MTSCPQSSKVDAGASIWAKSCAKIWGRSWGPELNEELDDLYPVQKHVDEGERAHRGSITAPERVFAMVTHPFLERSALPCHAMPG